MFGYVRAFVIAFVASLVLTFAVRTVARRFGLVAKPRPDRWHQRPTALFGGVGIYASFMLAFLVSRPTNLQGEGLLLLCASGMFALGLVDDILHLKPYSKLVVQIVCSTALTMHGMRLNWLPSPVLDQALTIFWLVGITNALNLLDNLDGVAGGVALIAGAYLVYFCHAAGNPGIAIVAAGFCGAVLGFLVFNFNPASIFMGDSGSLFLGFFLGGLTLVNNQQGLRRNVLAVLLIPVLLLLMPILDTTLVTISRKLHGRPVSQGGRDHTSHRLVALGLSDRAAALTIWAFAAVAGGIAVLVGNVTWSIAVILVPLVGFMVLFFLIFMGRVQVYEPVDSERDGRGRPLLPTLADFAYKRRVFEVLNDLVLIVVAYYAAFLLRFEGVLVEPNFSLFVRSLPIVIVVQLAAFLVLGMYRGVWRYTSVGDLPAIVRAVGGGWVGSVLALVFLFRLDGLSRAALVIDGVLLLGFVASSRASFRLLQSRVATLRGRRSRGTPVLIYGAGDGGQLLVRELFQNESLGLLPVGFVDDDANKHGRTIHGLPVLGPISRLPEFVGKRKAVAVIVSTSSLAPQNEEHLDQLCRQAGVVARRMRIALE